MNIKKNLLICQSNSKIKGTVYKGTINSEYESYSDPVEVWAGYRLSNGLGSISWEKTPPVVLEEAYTVYRILPALPSYSLVSLDKKYSYDIEVRIYTTGSSFKTFLIPKNTLNSSLESVEIFSNYMANTYRIELEIFNGGG